MSLEQAFQFVEAKEASKLTGSVPGLRNSSYRRSKKQMGFHYYYYYYYYSCALYKENKDKIFRTQ
jgi:hypothetical protein